MKIKPMGVTPDGTRHYEVSGLPGAPKDIPNIKNNTPPRWGMNANGNQAILPRPPKVGEAITVNTDLGSIRVRITHIREDRAMLGTVEILNTSSGTDLDIHGIRRKDLVIVRGMDFVTLVHFKSKSPSFELAV